jgi:predicted enzyme related to lactoylglutathione lyase
MSASAVKLGHVVLPVSNLDAAIEFCERALGLPLRFRDGGRYAALESASATLALATTPEQVVEGAVSVGLKVDDLDAATKRARDAGARILGDLVETAHDRRLALADPDGNILVLYQSRAAAAA